MPPRWFPLLFALSIPLFATPSAADPAAAEALFREGRALLEQGKLAEACPKLAESQRLDASPGTLGSLAQCHEKQGKIATAWAEYLAASRLAAAQGKQNVAEAAKKRAADLEPKLSYVKVQIETPAKGLILRRDEQTLEAAALGSRLPTDPGPHTFTAEAPGFQPFSTTVTVEPGKPEVVVTIPALKPATAGAPSAAPPATSTAPSGSSAPAPSASASLAVPPLAGRPTAGYVVGGLGVVALGVGAFFGLGAMSSYKAAEDACPTRVNCSSKALDDRDKAGSRAWGANIGLGLGVVGVAVVGSSRVDLQACKLEYSIVSPK